MGLWVSPLLWHLRWPTVSGGYRNWLERQIRLAKVPEKDRKDRRKKGHVGFEMYPMIRTKSKHASS
jgi:hypothetical protein